MQITILGCRGSYPIADPHNQHYGGDTTCVVVAAQHTLIVLDSGTGIRHLDTLPDGIRDVHLFITHLHWDHIIGFPQWKLLHERPDMRLHLYNLARSQDHFYAALQQSIQKPLYTRSLDDLFKTFTFHELRPGDRVGLGDDMVVSCALANHPYRALGYRVQHGKQVLAFVPDTAPFDRYLFDEDIVLKETSLTPTDRHQLLTRQDRLFRLIGDADWMIYDAALTPAEYEMLPHWGHSTMQQAAEIAQAGGVGELILFHHAPNRTDSQIDLMVAEGQQYYPRLRVAAAFSGMIRGT